jgi:hypothetical protein
MRQTCSSRVGGRALATLQATQTPPRAYVLREAPLQIVRNSNVHDAAASGINQPIDVPCFRCVHGRILHPTCYHLIFARMRLPKNRPDGVRYPILIPGISLSTSPTDYDVAKQLQLFRFDDEHFVPFGAFVGSLWRCGCGRRAVNGSPASRAVTKSATSPSRPAASR